MVVKEVPLIYQLKVTLSESKPPIWRRILVPSNINLGQLHLVLQIVISINLQSAEPYMEALMMIWG